MLKVHDEAGSPNEEACLRIGTLTIIAAFVPNSTYCWVSVSKEKRPGSNSLRGAHKVSKGNSVDYQRGGGYISKNPKAIMRVGKVGALAISH